MDARGAVKTAVVVDNPTSWFMPFARRLVKRLGGLGNSALLTEADAIPVGNEIAFLLSCERPVPAPILARSAHTVVVHASPLPRGRGMSPLAWQILEGKTEIPLTLFEAVDQIDAGPIYMTDVLTFKGTELLPEMQAALGRRIVAMSSRFALDYRTFVDRARAQVGMPTFYRRRTPADSQLDPSLPIADQFDLLRIVDNRRYPAFFEHRGRRYVLTIKPARDST